VSLDGWLLVPICGSGGRTMGSGGDGLEATYVWRRACAAVF